MSGDRGILGTLREYGERLRTLERHVSRLPSRLFGGGGGDGGRRQPPVVATLPPAPDLADELDDLEVFWGRAGDIDGGTGDGQVWSWSAVLGEWLPQTSWTPLVGTPGS